MRNGDFPQQQRAIKRARALASATAPQDGLVRETFELPREEARARARDFLNRFPKAAYWSRVESWRRLPDDRIAFTMVRLPSAD